MNNPRHLPTMTRLALAISAGDWREAIALDPRCGFDEQSLYETADWQSAASDALEGDHTELVHMLAREAAFQEFVRWQRADERYRSDSDFSEWLVCKAQWSRPNRFEAALNRGERRHG